MKHFKNYVLRIAILNLKHSLTRTVGLVFFTAILSLVLFGGSILMISLQKGLRTMKDRMGADVMIVPLENTNDMEAILLKGEPSCFYFKKTLEAKVRALDGVELCSSQFFLTSLDAECCDARVQLIGFDPATDFSIQPWITKVYDKKLENGAVIIGNDIRVENGKKIKLFGMEYEVAAKLDATGTGLDQAVYATTDTIKLMYNAAYEKGQRFLEEADPDGSISAILIRVKEDTDVKKLIKNIRKELGAVQVVESQSMIRGTADQIKQMAAFLFIFGGLLLVISIVTICLVYHLTLNERKKEFSVLRTLGVTRKKLAGILLSEAAIIGAMGGVAGIAISSLIVFPFHVYLGDCMSMPYLLPGIPTIFAVGLITFFATLVMGTLSASMTAYKISRSEVYLSMREGE